MIFKFDWNSYPFDDIFLFRAVSSLLFISPFFFFFSFSSNISLDTCTFTHGPNYYDSPFYHPLPKHHDQITTVTRPFDTTRPVQLALYNNCNNNVYYIYLPDAKTKQNNSNLNIIQKSTTCRPLYPHTLWGRGSEAKKQRKKKKGTQQQQQQQKYKTPSTHAAASLSLFL